MHVRSDTFYLQRNSFYFYGFHWMGQKMHTMTSKSHKLQIMNHMLGVYFISMNKFIAKITKPTEPTTLSKNAGIDTSSIFAANLLLLFFILEKVTKINAIAHTRNTVVAIFPFLKHNFAFFVRFLGIVKFPQHQIRVNRKTREIKFRKSSIFRNCSIVCTM